MALDWCVTRQPQRWVAFGAMALLAACHAHPAVPTAEFPTFDSLDCAPSSGSSAEQQGAVPEAVSIAVAHIKNLLTGLPATDGEVRAIAADATQFPSLVRCWMGAPQYSAKMLEFFKRQFQQDQFAFSDLKTQFVTTVPFQPWSALFMQNLKESFARTVLQLVAEGAPFTSTMTTTRFMMTPALMAAYATMDDMQVDDQYNGQDLFHQETPVSVTLESTTPTAIADVINPASASFMTFFDPAIAAPSAPGCPSGTIVYPSPVTATVISSALFNESPWSSPGTTCAPPPGQARASNPYIAPSDFTTWQMVRIRQPASGEATTQLFDLPSMRAGNELVLRVPRVGFFTTPAFNAHWRTNSSNVARVMTNQSLIVGLGAPIDTTNTTQPLSLAALDQTHAAPGTSCFACHQTLDPMRQYFRHDYTLYGSVQQDPTQLAMPGQFAFHGVVGTGNSIADFATRVATHPMFAAAWVQKLCVYATSQTCDTTDPEFQRLVGVFRNSNYSWNTLVQALFTSPLVTNLQPTQTATTVGTTAPISRQEHLCATLSSRLGTPDVCGLSASTSVTSPAMHQVQAIAASWPLDEYSRGAATPSQTNVASLLLRGGMENICTALAESFVDTGSPAMFQSAFPAESIRRLTTNLMGLTSDRAAGPQAILLRHFADAQQEGASASDAMKSTFVLACLSPYVVGIGQ